MQIRLSLSVLLVGFGIALLFAGLFFDTGMATVAQLQAATPASTPTMDRLAEPTLPASPSQADKGAQVYWLSCMPCHGDRGQGLTAEFRDTYPVEDRNCWNSGCHGNRPYQNGFTLPKVVPPVIGSGTLQKFPTAASLRSFIFIAMPYWKPQSLTEDQTLQITAFLLRQNNLWAAQEEITMANADHITVGPSQATATPQPISPSISGSYLPFAAGFITLILLIFLFRSLFRKRKPE